MRHHGRADDPNSEVQLGRAVHAGDQAVQRPVHGRADPQRLVEKAGEDDPQQRADRELKAPETAGLQRENPERDHTRHQPGRQQRHAEQQIQPDRGTDELGDVGRHRHDLGLHPHPPRERPGEVPADDLGQVVLGDDPELRREVLDEHRDEVCRQHHPQQHVAEPCAALDVGREVPGVDVRDRRDERGAEHEQRRAHPPAREQTLKRTGFELLVERQSLARSGAPERGYPRSHRRRHRGFSSDVIRIARASSPPSGCTRPSKRTNTGPPNGWRSTTSSRAPSAMPCSAR